MKKTIIAGGIFGIIVCFVMMGLLMAFNDPNNESQILQEQLAVEPMIPTQEKLPELTFGGRDIAPGFRYIALYGNPDFPTLGALGEQPIDQTVSRLKEISEEYQNISTEKVIPTFEIITTIASAGPTENQDYSQEIDIQKIRSWVDIAKQNNFYVVLDLQPGRSSFLSQAKLYEDILKDPDVGLALDPEWRLQTMQDRHLKKVGSVSADEINQTSEWLAELVKTHKLPQKIFMIHQFKLSMITNRENLNTNRKELAYIIHMDGHGSLNQKIDTWNNLLVNMPPNINLGWKNFYDEDKPTPTPEQTLSQTSKAMFVSYQ